MTPITVKSRGDPEKCNLGQDIKMKIIRVKELVTTNKEQLVVRCPIFLPHQSPAINKILDIKEYMHNHNAEVISGRVLIEGSITFYISYLSAERNRHNHYLATTTYDDFIDVSEANTEMVADVKSMVDDITVINYEKETQTLTVDLVINNTVLLYDFIEKTFITELPSDGKFEEIGINRIADVVKGCLKGFEEISIPLNKGPIKKIIKYNSMPLLQTHEVNLGSVTVSGWFKVTVFYLTGNGQTQYIERFVPFKKILAAPKARKHLTAEVFIISHQMEYSLLSNNYLRLKHSTCFKTSVFEPFTIRVLTEASNLKVQKETFTCECLTDTQNVEVIINDHNEINDHNLLEIEIKAVRVGPVIFLLKQLINKKVLLRGSVDFLISYMENPSENGKYLYRRKIFKAVVGVSSATNDSKIELVPTVSFTKAFVNGGKLTIGSLLDIMVKISNLKQIEIVKEINGPKSNVAKKNEVFFTYVMHYDDKLESLAARFGTTEEAIYKLNPQLTQPFAGKKIQIPCEVKNGKD